MEAHEQISNRVEQLSASHNTPQQVWRGLGRSSLVGRQPNGLPITERALDIEALQAAAKAISQDHMIRPQVLEQVDEAGEYKEE